MPAPKSVLRDKTFAFAIRIISFSETLRKDYHSFDILRQLVRSGTASGAHCREAQYAESTNDFAHKLSIALKEANETEYWLDLIIATNPTLSADALLLKQDCKEIIAMLVAATKTLKTKRKQ